MSLITSTCHSCKKDRTLPTRNLCHQCYSRLSQAKHRQGFNGSMVDFIIANVPGWVDAPKAKRVTNDFDAPCIVCNERTQAVRKRCLICAEKYRKQNKQEEPAA